MADNSNSGFIVNDSLNLFKTSEYGDIIDKGIYCLCKVKRFGKWFFLKGLQPEYAELTTYKEFLKKEFELEIQLEHPNIVRAISLEDNEKFGLCFTMEYVDGWTLAEFLATNPSRRTKKRICIEILSAMSYFHSMQIIHRDLKPQNILITRKGNNVKIIDFGLSDSDTYAIFKQAAGSDGYAAPEQLDETKDVDLRCDIYAFGKLLNLIFPHRYYFIKQKCTKTDKEQRYKIADEILTQIRIRSLIIPICLLFLSLGWFLILGTRQNTELQQTVKQTFDTIFIHQHDTIVIKQIDTIYSTNSQNNTPTNRKTDTQQKIIDNANKEFDEIAKPIIAKLQDTNVTQEEALQLYSKFLAESYEKRVELLKNISTESHDYYNYSNIINTIQQKYVDKCASLIDFTAPTY